MCCTCAGLLEEALYLGFKADHGCNLYHMIGWSHANVCTCIYCNIHTSIPTGQVWLLHTLACLNLSTIMYMYMYSHYSYHKACTIYMYMSRSMHVHQHTCIHANAFQNTTYSMLVNINQDQSLQCKCINSVLLPL